MKPLPSADFQHTETAASTGTLQTIDNRQLARLAKLAGAPNVSAAGLRLHKRVGETVSEVNPCSHCSVTQKASCNTHWLITDNPTFSRLEQSHE